MSNEETEKLRKWLLDSSAERYAAMKSILSAPGITDKMRKQVERALKSLERHDKEIRQIMGMPKRDS